MPCFLADENIEPSIIEGLKRQLPSVDFVTVREVGLAAVDDRIILEWAAVNGRIVVTRDVDSMIGYARDRVSAGLSMPGMVVISSSRSFASIIGSVFNMAEYGLPGEWEGQILYAGSKPIG